MSFTYPEDTWDFEMHQLWNRVAIASMIASGLVFAFTAYVYYFDHLTWLSWTDPTHFFNAVTVITGCWIVAIFCHLVADTYDDRVRRNDVGGVRA